MARAIALSDLADRIAVALADPGRARLRRPTLHPDAERHRGALLATHGERRTCGEYVGDLVARRRRLRHRRRAGDCRRPGHGDVPPGAHLLRSADRRAVPDPE